MTDEEKKAIEDFKECYEKDISRYEDFNTYTQYIVKRNELILNIIEKQSKEIEEYKKQLDLDYVDKHFVPIERYNQLEKEIEELKEENKEIRDWKYVIDNPIDLEKLKELDLIKIKGKEYISKDKIKAKIEEFKTVRDTILENEKELNRPMMTYDLKRNDYCEKMLQSLLEKE